MFDVSASRVAYDGLRARVRIDRVRMPDGSEADREIVERPDAVAVVALDERERVVLLKQYRHAVGEHLLELPAGLLDVDGESGAAAAQRELAEEAGLTAGSLEELVSFVNSAGWSDERTTIYLATDLRAQAAPEGFHAEAEEADMQLLRLPVEEAVAAAERGEVVDAKTLIGLLLVGLRRLHSRR